jgi:hypothetical protein
MTTLVVEIYEALRKAGVEEDLARAAARAVIGAEEKEKLATKADLENLRLTIKADIAGLKAEIQAMLNRQLQVMAGLMVAMTGIFAAIVKLF